MYGKHQRYRCGSHEQLRNRFRVQDCGIYSKGFDPRILSNDTFKSKDKDKDNDSLWDEDDAIPEKAAMYRLDPSRSFHPSSSFSSQSDSESDEEQPNDYLSQGNRNNDSYGRKDHRGDASFSISSSASSDEEDSTVSVRSVVEIIEDFILQTVVEPLSRDPNPSVPEINATVDAIGFKRKLSLHHLTQARSLTSILKVAAFCYDLLAPEDKEEHEDGHERDAANGKGDGCRVRYRTRKTTTTREVYYFYVTYFRDQRECDKAIWDLVCILGLPSRQSLGLVASPKGWFCGSIDVYNARTGELRFNGRDLDAHGMAITPSTYDSYSSDFNFSYLCKDDKHADDPLPIQSGSGIRIESDAKCILVIEKEGVYTRLSEDKFFLRYFPCILVTGKGFPDVATRRWVKRMQKTLKIPVYGLCDCNPFGVSVLDSYRHDQGVRLHRKIKSSSTQRKSRSKIRIDEPSASGSETEHDKTHDSPEALHWIGLFPSQIETMDLPPQVFQELTSNDTKRLDSLLAPKTPNSDCFVDLGGRNRSRWIRELKAMRKYKVELEALHWKGADYLCQFVYNAMLSEYERFR